MKDVMQHVSTKGKSITLTPAAEQHILRYLSHQDNAQGVRFSVKKTGCSGLSYVVDYVAVPSEGDIKLDLGEEEYHIFIDKASYPVLRGLTVDYVKQGLNYKFTFTNPNQTGACGCGESFTVD